MDDSKTVWQRIDEHSAVINQMQIDHAKSEARADARLEHLEQGQARHLEIMVRIERKIDSRHDELLKILAENTAQINQAQGGVRFGKWMAGVGLTLIGVALALVRYFRGV